MKVFEKIVEDALSDRGWLATDERPCLAVAHADDGLPYGWVRISDDYATLAVGPAVVLAQQISDLPADADYDSAWEDFGDSAPDSSREWPPELYSCEQIEEGTPNDNPNCVITVATNGGMRFAAGPHGVDYCALSDWLAHGPLAESRAESIESLDGYSV